MKKKPVKKVKPKSIDMEQKKKPLSKKCGTNCLSPKECWSPSYSWGSLNRSSNPHLRIKYGAMKDFDCDREFYLMDEAIEKIDNDLAQTKYLGDWDPKKAKYKHVPLKAMLITYVSLDNSTRSVVYNFSGK